jgi:N-methylhydantoinase A
MTSARLAVDIGGTFTDLALEQGSKRTTTKVLTTPAAPEQGVMTGIQAVTDAAGVALGDIELIIHGTTLATNAVIERKDSEMSLPWATKAVTISMT